MCARALRSNEAPPTQQRKAAASARCCCGDNAASEKAGAAAAENEDEDDDFLDRLDDDDDDSELSTEFDASATSRRLIRPLCDDKLVSSSTVAAMGCALVDKNTARQSSTKARHHASAAAAF